MTFYAGLRPIVGAKTVEVSVPEGATVAELLEELVQRWPALWPYLCDAEGWLSLRALVAVDGRSVRYLATGLATPLTPEHEIAIFPALAGGSK